MRKKMTGETGVIGAERIPQVAGNHMFFWRAASGLALFGHFRRPVRRVMLADFVFEAILALFDFFHPHAEAVELVHQVVDRAGDRVRKLAMLELGHILARALSL